MKKLVIIFLVLMLAGCSRMNSVENDLEKNGYSVELSENAYEGVVQEYKYMTKMYILQRIF
jgi:hypothetical protein